MIYGFKLDELPPIFQGKAHCYKLAQDGIWKTRATSEALACKQTAEIIRICSGEVVDPKSLTPIKIGLPKGGSIKKFNGKRAAKADVVDENFDKAA